jgi:outer membrane biosynthesis protein TonB
VLPGRLGLRFALEALFLLLLAVGAGLADLRPAFIVLVMALGWVVVAIVEFTAERISKSPLTYLLPRPEERREEPEPAWPMPEERTVVAPPEQRAAEPEPELEPEPEPEPEAEAVELPPEPQEEPAPEPPAEEEPHARRFGFWRRGRTGDEDEPTPPPRHVKLLPRRTAPESSRAAEEVAELFDRPDEPEERSG